MVKACFLGDGREWFWDHGTFGSWESPKQREQSFWAILYRHIYIYRWWCSFLLRTPGDFFQRPVTTNGGFACGQVYDVACISLGPCGHEDGAKPRQYAIQQFSQPFFWPQMTDWISRHPLVNDINDPSLYIHNIYIYMYIYVYIYKCIIFESPNEWLQCKTSFFENMCLLLGGRSCLPISLRSLDIRDITDRTLVPTGREQQLFWQLPPSYIICDQWQGNMMNIQMEWVPQFSDHHSNSTPMVSPCKCLTQKPLKWDGRCETPHALSVTRAKASCLAWITLESGYNIFNVGLQ